MFIVCKKELKSKKIRFILIFKRGLYRIILMSNKTRTISIFCLGSFSIILSNFDCLLFKNGKMIKNQSFINKKRKIKE